MIGPADYYRNASEADAFERSAPRGPFTLEQLRADVHPGDPGQLKRYWLSKEGLAKWAFSPHPWTALFRQLSKHMNPEMAKRVASQWYHDHFHQWPGTRKGKNKLGPG